MPFKRHLPTAHHIRELRLLRPVRHWLDEPDLWHLNRRSVSMAVLIGLFCAFLPIPLQTLPAVILGLTVRCNLPVCVALVWITNPITMPPILLFCYEIGTLILDRQVSVRDLSLEWSWLRANMGNIGYPLVVGSLVCGVVSGVLGFAIVRVVWRMRVIARWRLRRDRERLRRVLATHASGDGHHASGDPGGPSTHGGTGSPSNVGSAERDDG
ncbi:MAG: DUF2062 domain-containing protein [Gammaproteobacteria bacterium]